MAVASTMERAAGAADMARRAVVAMTSATSGVNHRRTVTVNTIALFLPSAADRVS